MKNRSSVISMGVNITNLASALYHVELLSNQGEGAYVCVSNVHMCMEVYDSAEFSKIVNEADLVIPDGKPLSWAQKFLGHSDAEQVRGQDIMNALCASSGEKSLNIGFYGGSSEALLNTVKEKLIASYPDINITYAYSPPFRPLTEVEDMDVVTAINKADVNVLFVGIGCPKQERWMACLLYTSPSPRD